MGFGRLDLPDNQQSITRFWLSFTVFLCTLDAFCCVFDCPLEIVLLSVTLLTSLTLVAVEIEVDGVLLCTFFARLLDGKQISGLSTAS